MPIRALTLGEAAAELGRSESWLARHWQREVSERGMPAPIHEVGGLVWSAPGFYAWLDRGLSPAARATAAAYRAALEAARTPPDDEVEAWRSKLDQELGQGEKGWTE